MPYDGLMSHLAPGVAGEFSLLVTHDVAVDFLGHEEARILGTPYLIGLLELTARNAVKGFLETGYDTVGTEVNVRHLAATPLGMSVRFHARVKSVENRRIWFDVEAYNEREKIAEGTHERAIISVTRFVEKLAAKKPVS